MDDWLKDRYPTSIDLTEIEATEVTTSVYNGTLCFDAQGVSVADLLDTIGIDTVKQYFQIEEGEQR